MDSVCEIIENTVQLGKYTLRFCPKHLSFFVTKNGIGNVECTIAQGSISQ